MSLELTLLTGLVALLALATIIRPAMLFEYPFACAVLMWFFIVPQAWRIEADGQFLDYQPTLTWGYMILCVVMTLVGFYLGKARSAKGSTGSFAQLNAEYDMDKLLNGAIVFAVVGGVAVILMTRLAATMERGELWSGPIAFYAMLSLLLVYGSALAWVLYLYTGNKRALTIAIVGLLAQVPAILFAARRELTFTVFAVFLLGLLFVKNKSVSRLVLLPMILVGGVFINQASAIRAQIYYNDSSLITALSSKEVLQNDDKESYTETASGVSDIAIASWTNEYAFFTPYLNTFVHLYVPAFIVGKDVKESLKIVDEDADQSVTRLTWGGSTRTGFADSFQSLHYLGCLIFAAIAYFMGMLWSKARRGHIKSQIYYMVLIPSGLKVFTESTCIFVGILPLIFVSLGSVFLYAKRRNVGAALQASLSPAGVAALQGDPRAR